MHEPADADAGAEATTEGGIETARIVEQAGQAYLSYQSQVDTAVSIPAPVLRALKQYGWSLPVCGRSRISGASTVPVCITVGELTARFPLHMRAFSIEIMQAIALSLQATLSSASSSEDIIGLILEHPVIVASVVDDSGVPYLLAIGGIPPELQELSALRLRTSTSSLALRLHHEVTLSKSSSSTRTEHSYQDYFDACEARRHAGGHGQPLPIDTIDSGEKKEEEAKKKVEEAKQKEEDARKEAERAKKEAEDAKRKEEEKKKSADEAQKRAEAILKDPNATPEQKRAAAVDAVTAGNAFFAASANARQTESDSKEAATKAEQAAAAHIVAKRDLYHVQIEREYGRLTEEAAAMLLGTFEDDPAKMGWVLVRWIAQQSGAWWGTYGPGGVYDCLQESCENDCHSYAWGRVLMDQVRPDRCNSNSPPDDNTLIKCLQMQSLDDEDWQRAFEWACAQKTKVASQLEYVCRVPPRHRPAIAFPDPCNSPYAMCLPDRDTWRPANSAGPQGALPLPHNLNEMIGRVPSKW